MDEATDFVFEVDSPFEVELVSSLAEFAFAGDFDGLVEWLVSHRARKIRDSREIQDRLCRLKKVVAAFGGFHRSYRECAMYKASSVSESYLREMESALSKAIEIDAPPTEEAEPLRSLFQAKRFRELESRLQQLASSDEAFATTRFLETYRRRLVDRGLLLDELVGILISEYNRKIAHTRKRLKSYVKLLEQTAERLEHRISLIDRSVAELQHDEKLGDEDRQQLLSSFAHRRGELLISEDKQRDKQQTVSRVVEEMRAYLTPFLELTRALQTKLAQHRARESYICRLLAVGSEVPKLNSVVSEVTESLRAGVGAIQKTFLLFNEPFQNSVLTAIDRQAPMQRILVAVRGRADVEIEIPVGGRAVRWSGTALSTQRSESMPDLSFLASIEARSGD